MDTTDSFELDLRERKRSTLKKSLVIIVVFACSAFVVLGQLHSIKLISDTFRDPLWLSLIWLSICVVHPLTVYLFSSTPLWAIDNRARIFTGCILSAVCAVVLDFSDLVVKELGSWTVGTLRIIQEIGFALVSFALPAALCTEVPVSANILIPLYNAVRGASAFFGASLDNWMTQLDKTVPYSVVAGVLGVTAAVSCCLFDSSFDSYRRATPRSKTIQVGWDITLVSLTSFTCFFNIVFLIVTLKSITSEHHLAIGYSVVLLIAAILYLISAPFVGMFIRWLPPRGVLLVLSLAVTVISLALLEGFLASPHLPILLVAVILFSLGVGVLPALMHMHLLDRMSTNIYGRHHVAAGRVVSVAATMGLLVASAMPTLLGIAADGHKSIVKCLLAPIIVTALTLLAVLVTMAVEIYSGNRDSAR